MTTPFARWARGRSTACCGAESLVEDSGRDAHERGAKPGPAGRADREQEAVSIERDARRHHALHPVTGLHRPVQQVDLAEHAVQVEVEAGELVAGAEAEARRQHACVAVPVDGDEVRRVRLGPGRVIERREQVEHALGRREAAQPR